MYLYFSNVLSYNAYGNALELFLVIVSYSRKQLCDFWILQGSHCGLDGDSVLRSQSTPGVTLFWQHVEGWMLGEVKLVSIWPESWLCTRRININSVSTLEVLNAIKKKCKLYE